MLLKVKSIQTGKIVIEQAFPADVQLITIGRSPDCDVVISDSRISRRHLKIQKIGEAYFIEDTNSVMGVYLDDVKLSEITDFDFTKTIRIVDYEIVLMFKSGFNYPL